MKTTKLYDEAGLRTFALVMDKGDDPFAEIVDFARREDVTGAALTAIGGFRSVTIGYFDPDLGDYRDNRFDEQLEVLSMIGDIATKDGEPALHAHVVLGRKTYATIGGHLRSADVFPTLEVVVNETPAHLRKRVDPKTGLALLALEHTS